jgi:hypothetical protein
MKTFLKRWRQLGILVWIYLDDILLVGNSASAVRSHVRHVLTDMDDAGLIVNKEKSILDPVQELDHLGFHLNLKEGLLQVPSSKLKMVRQELGKLCTHESISARKMAAILGSTRAFLMAMLFLRAFTDQMVQFVAHHSLQSWDRQFPVPQELKSQLLETRQLMAQWAGRPMNGKPIVRTLHSDSSDHAWAGVDVNHGTVVQEFWRDESALHINVKELEAAINTVRSLAKDGEKVLLGVDNSVAYAYLSKGGGRIPYLNQRLRPFLKWCVDHRIQLQLQQLKSAEDLADAPSRWSFNHGDNTLNHELFQALLTEMAAVCWPQVDMFASPGNHQLPLFVSRWPHWEACQVDALKCPLEGFHHCYANPPWGVIAQWLQRLRENPHLLCVLVCPYWVSAPWWPLLLRMQVKGSRALVIKPFKGMFSNCLGQSMPAPRWRLLCVVLSGQCWRPAGSGLKALKFI